MKFKGIPMKSSAALLFALVGIQIILFGFRINTARNEAQEQILIEENLRSCTQASQDLWTASNYLTGEAWHFVTTGQLFYAQNYWQEVNVSQNRNKALAHLRELALTEEELSCMENALRESDRLIEKEAWAMRLIADSLGIDASQLPEEMNRVRLTGEESELSPSAKASLAVQYLFGQEYTSVKEKIYDNVQNFQDLIRSRKGTELQAAVSATENALFSCRVLMLTLALSFALEAVLYYITLARPFSCYAGILARNTEGDFSPLPPMGAQETRSFANAFNRMYSSWSQQRERLEKERYRFRVALENMPVIVYEYDILSDTYTSYGSLSGNVSREDSSATEHIIPHFLSSNMEEIMGPAGTSFFRQVLNSSRYASTELPVCPNGSSGQEIWVRITCTPIPDASGQITRFIGKIINIQSEKEKEFALEDFRSRDPLTGFYQKDAGIRKIRTYLSSKKDEEICCLMLLDMDGFQTVNDREGHIFADAVLQDTADILRALTGERDILTRLGGDELMLFLPSCNKARARVMGSQIAEAIKNRSVASSPDLVFSASIGMCTTEVVNDYSGLYRCAESTLKYVKEHGKGQAACYLDTSNELGVMLTQVYPDSHVINTIDSFYGGKEDLPAFALDLLGKAKNLDDAIFLLLSRTGKLLQLDRIIMMEMNPEYQSYKMTYQWNANKTDRLPYETHYIPPEQLEELSSSYDDQGLCERHIFACSEDMESILHAGIWNYGECVGAMCFEHRKKHVWTAQERELLTELSGVISSFTLKARSDAVSRAKTDFLSRMSHEIRTPMNAITGMTTIARSVPGNPPKTLDCLNKIEASNRYLLTLINDVLDMSRIESGKIELHVAPVNLQDITKSLETLIRPQSDPKGLLFEIRDHSVKPCYLMADELRLNQILINLLGNAVKFTAEGGRVTLTIDPDPEMEKDGRTALRFCVSDTGIGISKEAQQHIFNAFEQANAETASNYGGTGLGLTISGRLVQMMGGTLEVESEPQKGASFFFTLSFATAQSPQLLPDTDPAAGAAPFDPAGKRLLLAEDNSLNREIAEEILQMHGFTVETAENGKIALELFGNHPSHYYDAILMDIRMPVMGGLEAARCIRTSGKEDARSIPIIAMTANAFDEDMKKSLDNGMDGHLSKPIDIDTLLLTLQRLLPPKTAV